MFVISTYSKRKAAQCIPLDLMRATLRAGRVLAAMRHNEGVYARLSGYFAGYLA